MEIHDHGMTSLFDQLGLPSHEDYIQSFIDEHRLSGEIKLWDADFWTENQAKFLREQIKADADWAVVIDTLDTSLRQ